MRSRRSMLAPGVIIAAFLASVIVFALMLFAEKKALNVGEVRMIFVAKNELPKGMNFSDYAMEYYFEEKQIPLELVPDKAVIEYDFFGDKETYMTIPKGSIVTSDMFAPVEVSTKGMRDPVLLSFKAEDIYQVTGGILRKGDMVHIYADDGFGNVTLRWENINIVSAFDSAGNEITIGEAGKATRFNIYLEKKDVEDFFSQLDSKQLRLVKVCKN